MAWIHGPHYLEKPRMESAGMKKKKIKEDKEILHVSGKL